MLSEGSRDSSVLMTPSRVDAGQPGPDVCRVRRTRASQKTPARKPRVCHLPVKREL